MVRQLTVYSNRNDFSQDEAISASKSWDFAERIQLEILNIGRDAIFVLLNKLDVKLILFRNGS